ncbi:BEM_HP_G0074330.mRNA.1.CDS.1 [Saccharomyces cerevisiae]|nr:BEM_HP_G0074330.mRNA.1.CDS.1 [Saccharomyces cerevisiae]CAI6986424.1 BEM_HP_G0074330.mRNA.1.CDS.1 [Saccharomyces cerevisiae]
MVVLGRYGGAQIMHDIWVITTSPACFEILYKYCKQKGRARMGGLIVKLFVLMMRQCAIL